MGVACPSPIVATTGCGPVHPCLHARVLPLEHLEVAICLVQRPWNDSRGIAPARGAEVMAVIALQNVGHDVGHCAVGALVIREVDQPACEEGSAVCVGARGRCEDLDVTGPAQALVTLRTISRYR